MCAEIQSILKNFNKMADSKIYFKFSIWKKKQKQPQNKKPNYTHVCVYTHTHTHTHTVNIFRALTLGSIVFLLNHDNTAYATVKFTKQSHQQSYRHHDFHVRTQGKNRHLPGILFAALQSRFPHMLLETSALKTQQWLSEKSYPFQVRTEMMRKLPF